VSHGHLSVKADNHKSIIFNLPPIQKEARQAIEAYLDRMITLQVE